MSTFVKSNTFANAATSDANTVNQNFDEIADFLNNNVVHTDGSKAMTGILLLPGVDPTSINQATRKGYVDNSVAANATSVTNEATTRASADTTLQTNINNEANARVAGDNSVLAQAQAGDTSVMNHMVGGTATVTGDGGGNFTIGYPRALASSQVGAIVQAASASLTFMVYTANYNALQATMCNPATGTPIPNRTEVVRWIAVCT